MVSRTMFYFIKIGKSLGRCKSCALKGNQRRYTGEPYKKILYNTPIYKSWSSMKSRCTRKNDPSYFRYGGRGIQVSSKWETFAGFLKDMGSTYKVGLSIERINNDGNYCKENCKWATKKEQANNRRSNRIIKFDNQKKTLAHWSDELGIKRTTISQRLDVYGWNVAKALTK